MAFMNDCESTPSHMASFADKEMKSGLKGLNQADIEHRLG